MKFTWDKHVYSLSFKRERIPPPWHKDKEGTFREADVTRMKTTVFLHLQVSADTWIQVSHASATCYHRDDETRETGRLRALAHLAPFVTPALRPLMFKAYFERGDQLSRVSEGRM